MAQRKTALILAGLVLFYLAGPGVAMLLAMDNVATPVDVFVDDQKVTDARVVIKQIDSYGPAWLAIHTIAADGSLGPVIGYAAVCDGMNAYLPVAIDVSKSPETLVAALHVDRGVVGKFEFPGDDTVAHADGQEILVQFTVSY
jgi:hypothetical protein